MVKPCFLCCVFVSSLFLNTLVSLQFPLPDQIEILMAFKNEFPILKCDFYKFPRSVQKTNSWTSKDIKSFDGVVFDNETGVVTELDLSTACLSGNLGANSSLFRLHHLRYLDISVNYFDSFPFLPEFGKLTNLEVLHLSNMGLVGEIPSSFSSLNRLTDLDLSGNELNGSFSPLLNLSKLSVLYLSNNLFSGSVPCSLLTIPSLSFLDLRQNHLIDSLEIMNCSSSSMLETLYLSNNRLSGRILEPLSKLTKLKDLDLSFQNTTYPTNFISLGFKSIESLDLSNMGLVGEIPSSFSSLNRLTRLDLSDNKLIGGFLPLLNLSNLSVLYLSNNLFSGNIPCSLLTMPFLSSLHLSENHLIDSLETMNCSSSSKLEFLNLRNNRLSGRILEPLSKLTNLQELDLSFQNTTEPINFVSSLGFKSLLTLNLSGTPISRLDTGSPNLSILNLENCNINEFPTFIKNLQNLGLLEMANNRLKGEVPKWLWSLPSLDTLSLADNSLDSFEGSPEMLLNSSLGLLDLRSNAFRGSLPIISPILKYILASNNSFTGDIPLSLCNQSYLHVLDLAHNNFSGSIPGCLINSSLFYLDLGNNNLIWKLPDIFDKSGSLETLDVSHNKITGKLPSSLTNCTYLEYLNVEGNRIADTFPFWLKDLPNLKVMVLRSNMFYGPVYSPNQHPLSFPQLRMVDISRNQFTGSLPRDYFFNWSTPLISTPKEEREPTYLGYDIRFSYYPSMHLRNKGINMELEKIFETYTSIDFSENKFGGQIPESIGLLKSLIVLNLSNNAFTGHIPSSWSNLTRLESLDLSRNQLTGKIPQELATLSFLAYINVSHNELTGQIPQGTQFGGQPKSSFEGNLNLCGLPLKESCFRDKVPSTPDAQKAEPSKKEQVLNWKAAAMGYVPGVLFGLGIGQVFYSYKPILFYKLFRL